ncbi:polysaccharide lyase family 8 super-sandwich domain-containing protein, partial [Thalassotalea sp. PP2-459]|uniref:polysaccharide lyase family 8 super-sandwich domain-containing protein n=1 Tax=Thalassotalea sp. PP2-459 TaxID=1742724 RepID=UPI000A7694CF
AINKSTGRVTGTPGYNDAGTKSGIEVCVNDGPNWACKNSLSLPVSNTNRRPALSGTPANGKEGVAYSFIPSAADPDGDILNYSIDWHGSKPSWATFNSSTGEISGTPTNEAQTYIGIEMCVNDGDLWACIDDLTISINRRPELSGTPANWKEGVAYSFIPTAADPDGDILNYTIDWHGSKPSWATFNSSTGEISGTPTNEAQTYIGIEMCVNDGDLWACIDDLTLTIEQLDFSSAITTMRNIVEATAPEVTSEDVRELITSANNLPVQGASLSKNQLAHVRKYWQDQFILAMYYAKSCTTSPSPDNCNDTRVALQNALSSFENYSNYGKVVHVVNNKEITTRFDDMYIYGTDFWTRQIAIPKSVVGILTLLHGTDLEQSINYPQSIANLNKSSNIGMSTKHNSNDADYVYLQTMYSVLGLATDKQNLAFYKDKLTGTDDDCSGWEGGVARKSTCIFLNGFKADRTFSQHNQTVNNQVARQIDAGNYGSVLLKSLTNALTIIHELPYSDETGFKNKILAAADQMEKHLLGSYGWMSYAGRFDLHTISRKITQKQDNYQLDVGDNSVLNGAIDIIDSIKYASIPTPDVLLELKTRAKPVQTNQTRENVNGNELNKAHFIGNRNFWHSDIMVQMGDINNSPYYSSVRGISPRTIGSESHNGEGLKNYFMGAGTHFLMKSGNEYIKKIDGLLKTDYSYIQPVWDWNRLPGITARPIVDFPEIDEGKNAEGANTFVGGVSDHQFGAFFADISRNGIDDNKVTDAKKSWIYFNNAIISQGSHINASCTEEPCNKVITSVEQSLYDSSDVTYSISGNEEIIAAGNAGSYTGNIEWVKHNGTLYYFPQVSGVAQKIHLQVQEQTGNWSAIGPVTGEATLKVFSLWIEHENNSNQSYRYMIAPIADSSSIDELNRITSLTTTNVHAAYNDRRTYLLAHNAMSNNVSSNNNIQVKLTSPGALLITSKSEGSNEFDIHISDPSQTLDAVTFELMGSYEIVDSQLKYVGVEGQTSGLIISSEQSLDLSRTIFTVPTPQGENNKGRTISASIRAN